MDIVSHRASDSREATSEELYFRDSDWMELAAGYTEART